MTVLLVFFGTGCVGAITLFCHADTPFKTIRGA